MLMDGLTVRFVTCVSSNTLQQWEILKTGNDRNNIRLCRRLKPGVPYECLTALSSFPKTKYQLFHATYTLQPSKEARELLISTYNQSDTSQHWLMNSTTHQLSNVQYPKGCFTTRHFLDPFFPLLLECNGYGYKSPNPQLNNKYQRFYQKPVLDKNEKQLCLN